MNPPPLKRVRVKESLAMPKTEIKHPPPQLNGKVSLEETIAKRRSVRRYRAEPLALSQLSQIL